MIFSFFTPLLVSSAIVAHAQLKDDGLTVSTREGPVIGTLVSPTVRQFLGIPYAVANRWQPPIPPRIRTWPIHTTKFSDACPQALTPTTVKFYQLAGLDNSTIFVPESEDCLAVNIWAPSVRRKQRTAVLLWVYGGSFMFGTSNIPTYNGQRIVRNNDDIMFVSFNYRTNIFGFPSAPQLLGWGQLQNFGLHDIDAALQWVHNNIASFGGDLGRVVLLGHSAGAAAIDAYTFAHPYDNKVKGVIELSNSMGLTGASVGELDPTSWNTIAGAVGCGQSHPVQLDCMRRVSSRELEEAVIGTNTNFGPVVDEKTIFSDTAARSASGRFLRVPLLVGTTQHEGDIFFLAGEEAIRGVAIPNLTEVLADLQTQLFTCLSGGTARDRVKYGVPTWRYQYQGIFPDISSRPDLRAYHAAEISIIFNTFPTPTPTQDELALSKFMQKAWVDFARDPAQGLVKYGWPRYSPNTTTLAQLGSFLNRTGAVYTSVFSQLNTLLGSTEKPIDSDIEPFYMQNLLQTSFQ